MSLELYKKYFYPCLMEKPLTTEKRDETGNYFPVSLYNSMYLRQIVFQVHLTLTVYAYYVIKNQVDKNYILSVFYSAPSLQFITRMVWKNTPCNGKEGRLQVLV